MSAGHTHLILVGEHARNGDAGEPPREDTDGIERERRPAELQHVVVEARPLERQHHVARARARVCARCGGAAGEIDHDRG